MSRAEFYRLVSKSIRKEWDNTSDPEAHTTVIRVVLELERAFSEHNAKFDSARFRRDCGITD